ncbi:MAG: YfcE family phosphodiesterase [Candidatus Lokiarchaeota archaeon]|nr:YfcE family phosphodiesterase [Candidatus Lokiarchaeota archaeon]
MSKERTHEKIIYRSLIIGDTHIPDRAQNIPVEIINSLLEDKEENKPFNNIFFTGDIVKSDAVINFLQELAAKDNILYVQGNMDGFYGTKNPLKALISPPSIPNLRIGLIHGHQIRPRGDIDQLRDYAEKINVHILISGHTHADFIVLDDNRLLLNPGSAVGAWSFIASKIPSYIIFQLSLINDHKYGAKVVLYRLKKTIKKQTIKYILIISPNKKYKVAIKERRF